MKYGLSRSQRLSHLPSLRGAAGFSLLELMMVLVMAAIILGIGAPSFQASLQRNRLQSTVSDVATSLSFARAEAVILSEPVALCPTVDTASCSGSNWETGWLLFVDNGAGTGGAALDGTLNGSEELLRIGSPSPTGVTVRTIGLPSFQNIVFLEDGRLLQGQAGTFVICDARGEQASRALVVSVSGQARLAVDGDGNGIVQDHTPAGGTDVVCPS